MVRLTVDVRAAIAVGDVPAPNKKCKWSYFVTHEQGLMIRQLSYIMCISIYTLSDLGVLSNLIGSLSLANEHYSPPTE